MSPECVGGTDVASIRPEGRHALPCEHLVQFYKADERLLTVNVCRFIREGLTAGNPAVVISTPEHSATFTRHLRGSGVDTEAVLQGGRLLLLDAQATLARFIVRGQPDWGRFEDVVTPLVRERPG